MAESDPNPKEPDFENADSRLRAFLRKAGPIITAERGINARTRVKLESLANSIKLPPELFEQGLNLLQESPTAVALTRNRWERAFARKLRGQLKDIKGGILTAKQEARAVRIAKEKFQLEELQAREIIREVARETGIGRISLSEAERHIDELVRERIGRSTWVDPSTAELFHQSAKRWGIAPERVEALINHYVSENRVFLQRKKRWARTVATGSTLLIFIVIGGVLAFILSRYSLSSLSENGQQNQSTDPNAGRSSQDKTPAWWDKTLQLSVVRAQLEVEGFGPLIPVLENSDPAQRVKGYQQLAMLFQDRFGDRVAQNRLLNVCEGLLVCEPSNSGASGLVDAFLSLATVPREQLPETRLFYEQAATLVDFFARQALRSTLPESRQELIRAHLQQVTSVSSEIAFTEDQAAERHVQGLVANAYGGLALSANDNGREALQRLQWLQPLARKHLSEGQRLERNSQFLLTRIPTDFEDWKIYQDVLFECVSVDNPLLYRLITLGETSPNEDLRTTLLERIAKLLNVNHREMGPEALAAELRRSLGVVPGMAEDETLVRWNRLLRRTEILPAIEDVINSPTPPAPDALAEIVHVTTLAYAMGQSPSRESDFDLLFQQGAPDLDAMEDDTSGGVDAPSRAPLRSDRDRMDRFVGRLENMKEQNPLNRVQSIRGLQAMADRFVDISPADSRSIAKYVVAEKIEEEHLEVVGALADLSVWNHLVLAVADQIEDSPLSDAWCEQITVAMTGPRLTLDGVDLPKTRMRRELLNTVRQRLGEGQRGNAPNDLRLTQLQRVYRDQLDQRAILNSPEGRGLEGLYPSAAMEQLIRERLLPASASIESDATAKQIDAICYLVDEDLPRTILLQRALIDALAARIVDKSPKTADRVEQLMKRFEELDRESTHQLSQLYLAEWCQLQLWMTRKP